MKMYLDVEMCLNLRTPQTMRASGRNMKLQIILTAPCTVCFELQWSMTVCYLTVFTSACVSFFYLLWNTVLLLLQAPPFLPWKSFYPCASRQRFIWRDNLNFSKQGVAFKLTCIWMYFNTIYGYLEAFWDANDPECARAQWFGRCWIYHAEVCVGPANARLINPDFFVLANILNFTRRTQFRRHSTNWW